MSTLKLLLVLLKEIIGRKTTNIKTYIVEQAAAANEKRLNEI